MKRIFIFLFFFLFLIVNVKALIYVDKCQILNISGEYYQQNATIINNTLSATVPCLTISAPNIIFDGNGFYISSTNNANGLFSNQTNTSIINANITTGGSIARGAINLFLANITIIRNTIARSTGGSPNQALFTRILNNLSIIDSTIVQGNLIFLEVKNITVINTTYSSSSVESVDSLSDLTRQWYFDVQANFTSSSSPILGVNVQCYDNTNTIQCSTTTGSNGRIPTRLLTEYVNGGGTRTYFTDYIINATYGNQTNSTSINVSTNIFHQVFFIFTPPVPAITIQGGGVIFNTSVSNSSITFSTNVTIDRIKIDSTYIYLYNVTANGNICDINHSIINSNLDSSKFCLISEGGGIPGFPVIEEEIKRVKLECGVSSINSLGICLTMAGNTIWPGYPNAGVLILLSLNYVLLILLALNRDRFKKILIYLSIFLITLLIFIVSIIIVWLLSDCNLERLGDLNECLTGFGTKIWPDFPKIGLIIAISLFLLIIAFVIIRKKRNKEATNK